MILKTRLLSTVWLRSRLVYLGRTSPSTELWGDMQDNLKLTSLNKSFEWSRDRVPNDLGQYCSTY